MKTEIRKKGTTCVRCGVDRKEVKRLNFHVCNSWGESYERHIWNDKNIKIKIINIDIPDNDTTQ